MADATKTLGRMTIRQARKFFDDNYEDLREIFYSNRTSPAGGLLNPRVVFVDSHGHLEIHCHYNGYDNPEDSWTWFLDPVTKRFYG